jgi:tetratricopeptide (TPR) repeat protein
MPHNLNARVSWALALILLAVPAARRLWGQAGEWDKHMKAGEKAYSAGFNQKHYWITSPTNSPASLANFAKAEQEYKAALDLTQSFPAGDRRTVKTLGGLAEVFLEQDRFAEAEETGNRAIDLLEKAVGPDDPDLGFTLARLALIYDYASNVNEAAPLWDRSLAILRKAGAVTPLFVSTIEFNEMSFSMQNKGASLQVCNYLIDLLEATGAPEKDLLDPLGRLSINQTGADKERTILRIIVIRQKVYGPEIVATLEGEVELARLYLEEGRYAAALAVLLQIQSAKSQRNSATAIDNRDLAAAYAGTGKYSQAEEMNKQIVAAADAGSAKTRDLNSWNLQDGLMALAKVYRQEHKFDEALEALKRADEIDEARNNSKEGRAFDERLGGVPIGDWPIQIELAETYREKGDAAAAGPIFANSVAKTEQPGWHIAPGDPRLAHLLDNYASLLRDQGKYDQAEDLYKSALAIWAKNKYPDHPDVAGTLTNYAALLKKLNRAAEAEPLEARASAILAAAGAPAPVI